MTAAVSRTRHEKGEPLAQKISSWSLNDASSRRLRKFLAAVAIVLGAPGSVNADTVAIGLQLYTVRTLPTLEERIAVAAEAGYAGVQGSFGIAVPELPDLLARHELSLIGFQIGLSDLRDVDRVIATAEDFGARSIVLSWLAPAERPADAAGWTALGRELDGIGRRLRERGIELAYHNHDFDFEGAPGERPIDLILAAAAPENLKLEPDLGWIASVDPVQILPVLEQFAGRVRMVHVKDMAAGPDVDGAPPWVDVGQGIISWEEVLPAAIAAGACWLIVEHDRPIDPAATAMVSYDYVAGLGLAGRPCPD